MRALAAAAHRSNRRVLLVAPTGKAVDVAVRECAGDVGYTVAKALKSLGDETLHLDRRTVVVVDEVRCGIRTFSSGVSGSLGYGSRS